MANVTIVDYGVGNIKSFAHIYERLNISVSIATDAQHISSATKLILPGVGAFDWAMSRLNDSSMRDALDKQVLEKKIPVLGVCVGMQMMAMSSDEGKLPGLGWFDAHVEKYKPSGNTETPLPHMGWNDALPIDDRDLFKGNAQSRFYFLHSYVFRANEYPDILATTGYGGSFVSAVRKRQIFGTQFHPEKSHSWGIKLLRNFAEFEPC